MISTSAPDTARPRPDLTFLRHRRKPAANPALADFLTGGAGREHHAGTPGRPEPAPARVTPVPHAPAAPAPSLRLPSAAPMAPATPAAPATSTTSLDLGAPADTSPALGGRPPTRPARGPSIGGGPDTSLDLGAPAASRPATTPAPHRSDTSLDLGSATPSRPAAHRSDTSLDLGSPASSRPIPNGPDTSLDLGAAARPAPSATVAPAPVRAPTVRDPLPHSAAPTPRRRVAAHPRIRRGVPTILDRRSPTVALTRVQSGVGSLVLDLAVSASVGDLVMGAAYQLSSGLSSTVDLTAGRRTAPPGQTRRPLLLAGRTQFERISVDLRCSTDLERFVVYGSSASGTPLSWGGTLLATTFGGDRVELPITLPAWDAAHGVAILASVHNVDGEWILRAEMNAVASSIRDACRAYGFDRITWLDDHTPID